MNKEKNFILDVLCVILFFLLTLTVYSLLSDSVQNTKQTTLNLQQLDKITIKTVRGQTTAYITDEPEFADLLPTNDIRLVVDGPVDIKQDEEITITKVDNTTYKFKVERIKYMSNTRQTLMIINTMDSDLSQNKFRYQILGKVVEFIIKNNRGFTANGRSNII